VSTAYKLSTLDGCPAVTEGENKMAEGAKTVTDAWPEIVKAEGEAIPQYLANSKLRFEQWILDTCSRHGTPCGFR